MLNDGGMMVIPDTLANAGGVIVSYFEWVLDLQAFFWKREEAAARDYAGVLHVLHTSVSKRLDMRTAAYTLGIQRVAGASSVRGIYP